jgi:hypothetical protein
MKVPRDNEPELDSALELIEGLPPHYPAPGPLSEIASLLNKVEQKYARFPYVIDECGQAKRHLEAYRSYRRASYKEKTYQDLRHSVRSRIPMAIAMCERPEDDRRGQ